MLHGPRPRAVLRQEGAKCACAGEIVIHSQVEMLGWYIVSCPGGRTGHFPVRRTGRPRLGFTTLHPDSTERPSISLAVPDDG